MISWLSLNGFAPLAGVAIELQCIETCESQIGMIDDLELDSSRTYRWRPHHSDSASSEEDVLSHNVGDSNYSKLEVQPWQVWEAWKLDPWEADIVKRIARTKKIEGKTSLESRLEDFEKIKHITEYKIEQLKKAIKNAN